MLAATRATSVPPRLRPRSWRRIPEALIRYSVGIEETADLITDLDQALKY